MLCPSDPPLLKGESDVSAPVNPKNEKRANLQIECQQALESDPMSRAAAHMPRRLRFVRAALFWLREPPRNKSRITTADDDRSRMPMFSPMPCPVLRYMRVRLLRFVLVARCGISESPRNESRITTTNAAANQSRMPLSAPTPRCCPLAALAPVNEKSSGRL